MIPLHFKESLINRLTFKVGYKPTSYRSNYLWSDTSNNLTFSEYFVLPSPFQNFPHYLHLKSTNGEDVVKNQKDCNREAAGVYMGRIRSKGKCFELDKVVNFYGGYKTICTRGHYDWLQRLVEYGYRIDWIVSLPQDDDFEKKCLWWPGLYLFVVCKEALCW